VNIRPKRRHPKREKIVQGLRLEYRKNGAVNYRQAAKRHGISHVTIRDWCISEKIGHIGISEAEIISAVKHLRKLLAGHAAEGKAISPKLLKEFEKFNLALAD
jgi:hypothetical protein